MRTCKEALESRSDRAVRFVEVKSEDLWIDLRLAEEPTIREHI